MFQDDEARGPPIAGCLLVNLIGRPANLVPSSAVSESFGSKGPGNSNCGWGSPAFPSDTISTLASYEGNLLLGHRVKMTVCQGETPLLPAGFWGFYIAI